MNGRTTIGRSGNGAWVVLLGSLACSGNPAPGMPSGEPDPEAAAGAIADNAMSRPLQIVFDWSLREREARFAGRGVSRVAPPDRARLDLFGPRGEAYLTAALLGDELRLPPGAPAGPLPPPPLLWSVLGVFNPPPGARLVGTARSGAALQLDYSAGDERWRFRFDAGRLRNVEWTRGHSRRTIEINGSAQHGLPRETVYRDHLDFVELRMTLDQAHVVDAFPPDIWTIGEN